MTDTDIIRQDIRDLRVYLEGRFEKHERRLNEVERMSSNVMLFGKLAVVMLPFVVAGFSALMYQALGG